MGNTFKYHMHPDEYPYDKSPIEFDPLYGFPEGARKQKGYYNYQYIITLKLKIFNL